MKIKFITSNDAEVLMNAEELTACGIEVDNMSLSSNCGFKLIELLFDALDNFCGLRRDGKFTLVECQPYLNGGCRFEFRFIDEQSTRLYIFDSADDMLDAMTKLDYNEYFSTSRMDIHPMGNKFFMYIPQTAKISKHNLAVLSEYCA